MRQHEIIQALEAASDEQIDRSARMAKVHEARLELENQRQLPGVRFQNDMVLVASVAMNSFEARSDQADDLGIELLRVVSVALGSATVGIPGRGDRSNRPNR